MIEKLKIAKSYLNKKVLVGFMRETHTLKSVRLTKDMVVADLSNGQVINFALLKDPETNEFLEDKKLTKIE